MYRPRALLRPVLLASCFIIVQGCGDTQQEVEPAVPPEPAEAVEESPDALSATEPEVADNSGVAGDVAESPADDDEEISPESLQQAGQIELKQYTVAYIGSGTMGGGTLTLDGESYPFKIAGLGIGGFGASAVDATGIVYNLANLDAFPGTYGNARLGMTAGDSGGGKLWLRNPSGVVIELQSEMRGLALSSGVDGILIQWDDDDSAADQVLDETERAVGDTIEAGAEVVEDSMDAVKGFFKKNEG